MRLEFRQAAPEDLPRWLTILGAVLLIALGVIALDAAGVQICLFRRWTGLPCLTCGGTRAFAALATGDVIGAFRQQPLVSALLTVGAAAGAIHSLLLLCGRCLTLKTSERERRALLLVVVVLAVANWLYLLWRWRGA
ncbi:MAG TPA: DUF2752 domain-containing protein [Kiritimatiellia bacterium]|jgi:hypothetical protein|nr:DUF2752 domain-containing protein [Kiritimatiellia bacterium]